MMLSTRRAFLAASAAGAVTGLAGVPVLGKAPLSGRQVPGVYRQKVGAVEITAILDGFVALDTSVFSGAPQSELKAILAAAALPETLTTAVNAFVVNTGERTYLVDSGAGSSQAFGPNLGRLAANLAAAGITPQQIDAIILTHAHIDHVEGLISAEGQAIFPNAEVVLHEREAKFWLDDANLSRAPEAAKPLFQSARKSLAPYARRTRLVSGDEVFPGIALELATGHTPGHSIVRVTSGSEQMLLIGDTIHNAAIHAARPDVGFAFDSDSATAALSRQRVFDMIAADRTLVAGTHIGFPGFGRLVRDGRAFRFIPAEWAYSL